MAGVTPECVTPASLSRFLPLRPPRLELASKTLHLLLSLLPQDLLLIATPRIRRGVRSSELHAVKLLKLLLLALLAHLKVI